MEHDLDLVSYTEGRWGVEEAVDLSPTSMIATINGCSNPKTLCPQEHLEAHISNEKCFSFSTPAMTIARERHISQIWVPVCYLPTQRDEVGFMMPQGWRSHPTVYTLIIHNFTGIIRNWSCSLVRRSCGPSLLEMLLHTAHHWKLSTAVSSLPVQNWKGLFQKEDALDFSLSTHGKSSRVVLSSAYYIVWEQSKAVWRLQWQLIGPQA